MKNLRNTLKTMASYLLTNERINTQRCLCKDMDTTATIIDHKKTSK